MRNKPLPGMMKHSPMKAKTKTHSTQSEDPSKKMGYTKEFKKLKKMKHTKVKSDVKMKPPYKRPTGPKAN